MTGGGEGGEVGAKAVVTPGDRGWEYIQNYC